MSMWLVESNLASVHGYHRLLINDSRLRINVHVPVALLESGCPTLLGLIAAAVEIPEHVTQDSSFSTAHEASLQQPTERYLVLQCTSDC